MAVAVFQIAGYIWCPYCGFGTYGMATLQGSILALSHVSLFYVSPGIDGSTLGRAFLTSLLPDHIPRREHPVASHLEAADFSGLRIHYFLSAAPPSTLLLVQDLDLVEHGVIQSIFAVLRHTRHHRHHGNAGTPAQPRSRHGTLPARLDLPFHARWRA